jgi:hypothetical protein
MITDPEYYGFPSGADCCGCAEVSARLIIDVGGTFQALDFVESALLFMIISFMRRIRRAPLEGGASPVRRHWPEQM